MYARSFTCLNFLKNILGSIFPWHCRLFTSPSFLQTLMSVTDRTSALRTPCASTLKAPTGVSVKMDTGATAGSSVQVGVQVDTCKGNRCKGNNCAITVFNIWAVKTSTFKFYCTLTGYPASLGFPLMHPFHAICTHSIIMYCHHTNWCPSHVNSIGIITGHVYIYCRIICCTYNYKALLCRHYRMWRGPERLPEPRDLQQHRGRIRLYV